VHGYYIGYKFQQGYKQLSEERQEEMKGYAFDLLYDSTRMRSTTPRTSTTSWGGPKT